MGFSSALIFLSAFIVSSSDYAFKYVDPYCPFPEQIKPCTCSILYGSVTAVCKDIDSQDEIGDVFSKNPDWNLEEVRFEKCTFNYIPSSIVKTTRLQNLTVTSGTLVSLFDAVPVKTSEIRVNLLEVKISRGIQWKFFSNLTLLELRVRNMDVPIIGNSFKKHMPKAVKHLWLQNTKTAKIKNRAFQRLVNVGMLSLTGGSLKTLSRNMFPRPWNIYWWNLENQKLTELPEDFFADLPNLDFFSVAGNYFTTISEEVFTMSGLAYFFNYNPINCNCRVKWITTTGKDTNKYFYGTCSEPESVKGRLLESLTKEDFSYCRTREINEN